MSYWRKMLGGGGGGGGGDVQQPQQDGLQPPNGTGGGGLRGMIGNTIAATSAVIPQGIVNAARDRKMAGQVSNLLLRIQTSTIGRDRREAVTELCDLRAAEVAEHIRTEDLSMLLMVAEMNRNDSQLLTKILELIASVTEERVISDQVREALLHELLQNHVSVFLDSLVASTSDVGQGGDGSPPSTIDPGNAKRQSFWIRYHAIKILQRLQEYDSMNLQKQLLTSNKLGAIIDILHDDTNDGALRSEGMILLEHITMTDMELQTILAFDSCFETLLGIVSSEGGVNGDVTSVDCLRIIHNMLRNNKATQKFFREMGLTSSLKPLLVDTCSSHNGEGSPDGRLTQKGFEIVLAAVDVIQCLLRFGDNNGEGPAARDSIANSGLIEPLCTVAFSSRLDERTPVAALRTISLLAVNHRPTGEHLMAARINTKDAVNVPGLWACLHTALYNSDLTSQAAALQIVGAAMQTPGTGAQIASFLVKGLAPTTGGAAAVASQQSGREGGLQCGLLLSNCLMHISPPTPNARYYAAWVLNQSILVPQITEQMLFLPWQGRTFFLAYVRQLEELIRTRQCNLATVAMLIRPLFTWFAFCGKGVLVFLGGNATGATLPPTSPLGTAGTAQVPPNQNVANGGLNSFNFFLEWSNNTRDPMHLRFLSAMVCVAVAVACPSHDLPSSVQTNKEDLIRRICAAVRLGMLEELIYNVSSSPEWLEPPTNILHARTNSLILYDKDYVAILTELSSVAKRWLSGPPPTSSQLQSPVDGRPGVVAPNYAQGITNGAPLPPGGFRPPLPQPVQGQGSQQPAPQQLQQQQANGNQQQQQLQQQQQKFQQQIMQYETMIRQLQSELKTRDNTIGDLTESNEKLVFQNDELAQRLAGGDSTSSGRDRSDYSAAVKAKDDEIRTLSELVHKLEARLAGDSNKPAIPTLPLSALNGHNLNSLTMATPRAGSNPFGAAGGSLDTGRSVTSNYTAMTDMDTLQIKFEEAAMKLRVLESERDELLILVAELDEENEILKQVAEPEKADIPEVVARQVPPPQITPSATIGSISSAMNTPRPILKQPAASIMPSTSASSSLTTPMNATMNKVSNSSQSDPVVGGLGNAHAVTKNLSSTSSSYPTVSTSTTIPPTASMTDNPFQRPQTAPHQVPTSLGVTSPNVTNPDPFGMESVPDNAQFISSIFNGKPPSAGPAPPGYPPTNGAHFHQPAAVPHVSPFGSQPTAPPPPPPKTVSFAQESVVEDLR